MGNRGLVALLLCGVFSIAQAQTTPSPWYIGAGVGASTAKMNKTDFPSFGNHSEDKSGTAYKIFAGYRFSLHFGAEVSYSDLGKSNVRDGPVFIAGLGAVTLGSEHHNKAGALWGIGSVPISPALSLFGKAGIANVRTQLTVTPSAASVNPNRSASKTGLAMGFGASYDFAHRMSVRFEYENFGKIGNSFNSTNDVGRSKISAWSLGVGFRF